MKVYINRVEKDDIEKFGSRATAGNGLSHMFESPQAVDVGDSSAFQSFSVKQEVLSQRSLITQDATSGDIPYEHSLDFSLQLLVEAVQNKGIAP
jgi:hypothetical protein